MRCPRLVWNELICHIELDWRSPGRKQGSSLHAANSFQDNMMSCIYSFEKHKRNATLEAFPEMDVVVFHVKTGLNSKTHIQEL